MSEELKKLAEAAKGWKLDTVIPANEIDVCRVGQTLDDDFHELVTIDCENYYGDSIHLGNYFVAASPDAVLKLIAERDALYEALKAVLAVANVRIDDARIGVFDDARAALASVGCGE